MSDLKIEVWMLHAYTPPSLSLVLLDGIGGGGTRLCGAKHNMGQGELIGTVRLDDRAQEGLLTAIAAAKEEA